MKFFQSNPVCRLNESVVYSQDPKRILEPLPMIHQIPNILLILFKTSLKPALISFLNSKLVQTVTEQQYYSLGVVFLATYEFMSNIHSSLSSTLGGV